MSHKINGNKKVIYLALEEDGNELKKYFKELGVIDTESNLLIGNQMWLSENNIDALEQDIKVHNPSLCIIDTFVAFSDLSDMNEYSKVYKPLQRLSSIARSEQCHIIIVHHKNKGESNGAKSIMGSQAFFAAVDSCFLLSGEGDKKTLKVKPRYRRELEITFDMTPYEISNWIENKNFLSCKEALLEQVIQAGEQGLEFRNFKGFGVQAKQAAKTQLESEGLIRSSGGSSGNPLALYPI